MSNPSNSAGMTDAPDSNRPVTDRMTFRVVTAIICLSIIAFSLTCHLCIAKTDLYSVDSSQSLADAIFGSMRSAMAAEFYTKADVYFHRGVPHLSNKAFKSDVFQKLHSEVAPDRHAHASGESGIKEIMPWLDLTIRTDPSNVEAYLVAAFWLRKEAKRTDLALSILNRAQQAIPYDYEVQLAKARLFLHEGAYVEALAALNAALAFWDHSVDTPDHDHLLDKAEALLYRSLLHEQSGMIEKATADIRDMLKIFPDREVFRSRLMKLERGEATEPPAQECLSQLLSVHEDAHGKCSHEDDEHAEHSGH